MPTATGTTKAKANYARAVAFAGPGCKQGQQDQVSHKKFLKKFCGEDKQHHKSK